MNSMFIVVNGIIGRGINGVSGIVIQTQHTLTEDDMYKSLVTFEGEIIGMDDYFPGHALSGKHTFHIPPKSIIMATDDNNWVSNA